MSRTLRLPAKHALDWHGRFHGDWHAEVVKASPRFVTMELDDDALCDLIADSLYYVDQMEPENTGGEDYRPAARRCLAAIDRQVAYTHSRFVVRLA